MGEEAPQELPQPEVQSGKPDMSHRRKDKVCIVGFADSKVSAPYDDRSYEFWGVNEMWADGDVKHCDVIFELHDYAWICEGKRLKDHIKWLRNNREVPVWMQREYPDIPMSFAYPKEMILKRFGGYFTNTISWEIALAIQLEFKEIRIYGVNMANEIEYQSQRPSCEYFIGLARGMGIEVYIPPESDLLQSMYLYGFEDGELSRVSAKIDAYMHEQDVGMGQSQNQMNQGMAMYHQRLGAKNAAEYLKKSLIYPGTGNLAEIPRNLKER